MINKPNRVVEVSFEYAFQDDPSPKVTIYNSPILIPSLSDQVGRYGLHRTTFDSPIMVGQLQGGEQSFVAMIHSYGYRLEVSPPIH